MASEIPAAVSDILKAVGSAEISPSEAQSVVTIIEAQRKALETADLLRRIEELEDAAGRK